MKNMTRMADLRFLVCVVGLAMGFIATGPASAQDIVGILPELIKPEVAKRLQLTEDQIAKVRTLISQRMAAVVGLGLLLFAEELTVMMVM